MTATVIPFRRPQTELCELTLEQQASRDAILRLDDKSKPKDPMRNGLMLGLLIGWIAGIYLAQITYARHATALQVDRTHKGDKITRPTS